METVQRQQFLGAVLIHNIDFHPRKQIFHTFIKHPLPGNQRIFAVLGVHLLKTGYLAVGFINPGFLFRLGDFDDLVTFRLCLSDLFVPVLIGIVNRRLFALLGVFHIFKSIHHFRSRRERVLYCNIDHRQPNILRDHPVGHLLLDLRLDSRLPCGDYVVHIINAHGIADIRLGQHFQSSLRVHGCVEILDRVADHIFQIKVRIDKIKILGNHHRFLINGFPCIGRVANRHALNPFGYKTDTLD